MPWNSGDESIQLFLFKKQFPSRYLSLSNKFVLRMGWTLLLGVLFLITSIGFSIHFYRQSLGGSQARVETLQKEILDLKAKAANLETQESKDKVVSTSPRTDDFLARFFSSEIKLNSPIKDPPIAMKDFQTRWQGKQLRVTFNVQYTKEDGGNQQGYIFLVLRGASGLIGYPEQSFASTDPNILFAPDKGEHFSVSRFRGVQALFGPFRTRSEPKQLDVYLFNDELEVLIHETQILSPGAETNDEE